MFGRDNGQKQDDGVTTSHDEITAAAEAIANDRGAFGPPTTTDTPSDSIQPNDNYDNRGTLGSFMASAPAPTQPVVTATTTDDSATNLPIDNPVQPVATNGIVAPPPRPIASGADTDGLLNIKHEALQSLTPLIGQLSQSPEEQFRTTMMMIQASDNYSLLRVAYDAAQKISDEKERAQALLDIVNEINYFTQQP
jgi:hypothetical protein